jgi:hypothetical protein
MVARMLPGMANMPDNVCEHCLIGMSIYSLYGRQRVYECDLDLHQKDCLAGFFEPCDGSSCGNYNRNKGEWIFKYKQISSSFMRKSEECLQQEREERQEREEKARRLRKKAEELLLRAGELEN